MKIKIYDDVVARYQKETSKAKQSEYTIRFLNKIQGQIFEVTERYEDETYFNTIGFGTNKAIEEAVDVDGYAILDKFIEDVIK